MSTAIWGFQLNRINLVLSGQAGGQPTVTQSMAEGLLDRVRIAHASS
jgi:hypothetical protein